MVLTYKAKTRNARKNYQRHLEKVNSGAPVRSKRKHSSPLPISNERISRSKIIKRLHEDLPTTTINKLRTAADEPGYDRILLLDDIVDTDELYLTEEQIDKMFQNIQTAANNRYKVKYLSVEQFESNAPLPSIEDTDIIVVPLVQRSNRQINLAVFNLLTSTVWLFCQYYQQKRFLFNEIKSKMETQYEKNFYVPRKAACDKLINTLPYWYNDIVLVFRTAEELFFTGGVKKFDNFNLDAERKRYRDIYDLINSNDWDGNWPPTLQSEDQEINEEEENVDGAMGNGTSATSSSNDIQIIESSETSGGTNNSRSIINEPRSSVSDFYDFDDLQSPRQSIPHHTAQSTSPSLASSSFNVVNNQSNSSILPHNRPLVAYSISSSSTNSDHEMDTTHNSSQDLISLGNENVLSSSIVSLRQPAATESDSNVFSSIYSQSTSNDRILNGINENDVAFPQNDVSDLQDGSISTNCRESTSSDVDIESSTSNDSIASTETAVPRVLENYDFHDFNKRLNWDRSLPPRNQCRFTRNLVCPSLSSIGSSSSDSEDDEEINVGLSPRFYNDTNDLSDDEEKISVWLANDLDMNCRIIRLMFRFYWETVQKLSEDRQRIIRILKKRLEPEQYLRFNNDEEVIRVNIEIKKCETLLNSFIPIVPKWKATYQKDTDKKIIIRKGFIYERIGETDEFQCVYKKDALYGRCVSLLYLDNCDTLIDGSFCYHNHPAADNEKYTNDVPPPPEAPVSFRRVTKEGQKWGNYSKLIKFLKETVNELNDWQSHAMLCEERLNLLKQYVKQMEAADHPNNKIGIRCKMVVVEAKNLLNCVRLDK